MDDLLQHTWITGVDVADVPLTSALTELRRFHARKKFKAAVHSVRACALCCWCFCVCFSQCKSDALCDTIQVKATISMNRALGIHSSNNSASSITADNDDLDPNAVSL